MDKKALTAVLALRRWSASRSVDGQKREKAKQTHQSAGARTEGEHPRHPYLPPTANHNQIVSLGGVYFQPKPSRRKI